MTLREWHEAIEFRNRIMTLLVSACQHGPDRQQILDELRRLGFTDEAAADKFVKRKMPKRPESEG